MTTTGGGAHDDLINAVAGVLVTVTEPVGWTVLDLDDGCPTNSSLNAFVDVDTCQLAHLIGSEN